MPQRSDSDGKSLGIVCIKHYHPHLPAPTTPASGRTTLATTNLPPSEPPLDSNPSTHESSKLLKVVARNCRGFANSIPYIHKLINNALQKFWDDITPKMGALHPTSQSLQWSEAPKEWIHSKDGWSSLFNKSLQWSEGPKEWIHSNDECSSLS